MKQTLKQDIKNRRINIKLFPIYKMLSWDLLFFYSIIFLYLVQVKGISASQVLLADAIYNIATLLFLLPSSKIVEKIGKRNSIIFANICVALSILIILNMTEFFHLAIAYGVMAFGYSIKTISENIVLYDSLPKGKRRGKLFSIIDGKASSYFYYIDAISAVVTGFLYVKNPNYPLILCLITCIFSIILSFGFKHTNTIDKTKSISSKNVKMSEATEHVKNSKRLLYLILFYAVFSGLLYILTSLRSSLFENLKLDAQYFGIIFAIFQIVAGISARFQDKINNKFKNETLAVLSLPLTMSCMLIGILGRLNPDNFIFSLILILFIIQGILKGPYRGLIVRYVSNFTNKGIRTKLATIQSLAYYSVSVVFSLLSSYLLKTTSTANAFMIIGIISTFLVGTLLYLMKGRVGLSPEKYSKEDLKYSHLNKEKLLGDGKK